MKVSLLLFISLLTTAAHAEDSKEKLLAAVRSANCDEATISSLLKSLPIDEEVVFESILHGCAAPFKNKARFRAWWSANSLAPAKSLVDRYLAYFNSEVMPEARAKVAGGGSPAEGDKADPAVTGFAMELARSLAQKGCEKPTKNAALCQDVPKIKAAQAEFIAVLEKGDKNKKRADVRTILRDACPLLSDKDQAEKILQRQRDGAKESGFVDSQKMYDAGQLLAKTKKELLPYEAEYKRVTGKSLSLDQCPASFSY